MNTKYTMPSSVVYLEKQKSSMEAFQIWPLAFHY